MNAGTNVQTYFGTAKSSGMTATEILAQHRLRIPCPRCIGGSVFHDRDDEYVCIQCGFSHYPERISRTKPTINNESGELAPQQLIDSINDSPKQI